MRCPAKGMVAVGSVAQVAKVVVVASPSVGGLTMVTRERSQWTAMLGVGDAEAYADVQAMEAAPVLRPGMSSGMRGSTASVVSSSTGGA